MSAYIEDMEVSLTVLVPIVPQTGVIGSKTERQWGLNLRFERELNRG